MITAAGVAGSWSEAQLRVSSEGPTGLRLRETYDRRHLRDYEVLVDGVVVHRRSYTPARDAATTSTYQVLLPAGIGGDDDLVTIRIREDGANADASIADIWTIPVRSSQEA